MLSPVWVPLGSIPILPIFGSPLSTSQIHRAKRCQKDSVFASVFKRFNAKKAAFYSLYETFPHITNSYRKKTAKFLDKFFKIINTPSLVQRYIHDKCVERSRL